MTKVYHVSMDTARWGQVQGAGTSVDVWFIINGDTITLTHENSSTPLMRARGEKWQIKFGPEDNVETLAKRLKKRQRLAEAGADTGLSGPPRLLNPKIVAPY